MSDSSEDGDASAMRQACTGEGGNAQAKAEACEYICSRITSGALIIGNVIKEKMGVVFDLGRSACEKERSRAPRCTLAVGYIN